MNFIKKLLLIFTGILISLLILEILLQIAVFPLTTLKKYQNKKLKDPDAITILCLGESTTDGQWPPILQKILDTKAKHKKFRVIDEGHIAKNSEYLLYEIVEKKLNFYKPEVVISMIGANDATSDKPYIIKNTNFKLKTFSLLVLIKQHLIKNDYSKFNMAAFNKNIDENILNEIMQMAALSFDKEKSSEILEKIKRITLNYPEIHYYESIIPALVNPYFNEIILKNEKNHVFSIDNFTDYYKISSDNLELDKIYILFAKKFFSIQDYYNAVLCAKFAIFYSDKSLASIKHIIEIGKKLNINPLIPYDKLEKRESKNIYSVTKIIYPKIAEIVFDAPAQLIAMQYPTLPIESLKNYLNTSKYYDKIIFISNTKNFKETLKTHKIEDIFKDMFGGSFGHCTELGNTIIAENVAETILSLYDKE